MGCSEWAPLNMGYLRAEGRKRHKSHLVVTDPERVNGYGFYHPPVCLFVHPLSLHPFTLLSKQLFLLWFGAFKTLRHFEGGSRDLQVLFSIF